MSAVVRLPFNLVGVFTERPYGGSPLAVVTRAQALPTAALSVIAGELRVSKVTRSGYRAGVSRSRKGSCERLLTEALRLAEIG